MDTNLLKNIPDILGTPRILYEFDSTLHACQIFVQGTKVPKQLQVEELRFNPEKKGLAFRQW